MPSNEPLNLNKLYQTNDIIMLVKGEITEKDVSYLNGLNKKIILVLKNTKGQNSQIIKKLNGDNITFSVLGGLDYNSQKKFRSYDYVSRTLNSPQVLAKIIEEYEAIERGIDPSWDDTLKCAYVYKTLTEKLHYKYNNEETYCRIGSHTYEVTRSLSGIIFGRLVCSGFALVFKEAMDRLGITCIYQNKKGRHSWDIVKLAGAYRGIELTWECYSKENNSCSFDYFGLNPNFYQESSHDISNDKDETMYPLKPFQQSEIQEIIKKVNKGLIKEEPFFEIINNDGIKIDRKSVV